MLDQRLDQNRTNTRPMGSPDVGHQLISNHDHFIFFIVETFEGTINPKSKGFERPSFIVNIKFLNRTLDPFWAIIGHHDDPNPPITKVMQPLAHLRGTIRIVPSNQGVIQIHEDCLDALFFQVCNGEIIGCFHRKIWFVIFDWHVFLHFLYSFHCSIKRPILHSLHD